MSSGTIRYHAASKGLHLEEIKIPIGIYDTILEEISIKTVKDDRSIEVSITFGDDFNEGKLSNTDKITNVVNMLLDRISVELNKPIGEPAHGMWIPACKDGEVLIPLEERIGMLCNMEVITSPSKKEMEELKEKLINFNQLESFYFSQYRFSIRQDDAVAKFMFLYNLLLSISGDQQKKLDEFIRACNPEVSQTKSPLSKGDKVIMETVYTRLRNEVAHIRADVVPESTIKEIKANVGEFQRIVNKAVLKNSRM